MNYSLKKLMKLSVKQIKAYGFIVAIISTFSIEAIALVEEPKMDPVIMATIEERIEERIEKGEAFEIIMPASDLLVVETEPTLESWMLTPFEVPLVEASTFENIKSASSDLFMEPELALESWMLTPFEVPVVEAAPIEDGVCSPTP